MTGALAYAKTFAYDGVGNRLTQTTTGAGAATVNYAYDVRDRLTTENTTNYGYDANGNVTSKAGEATYGWDFENRLSTVNLSSGTVVAHQYDVDGTRVQTSVTPPAAGGTPACQGNAAAFVKEDGATLGNWQGTYGSDGYTVNALPAVAPAYGSVSFSNASSFTWDANNTFDKALQQPPPQTSRIASTYFSFTNFTIHVATTDNRAHTVALYMPNWDAPSRTQTVTAQTSTGMVLDSARPFTWLSTGVYAVYTICGSVDFVVTAGGAPSAVVSGVFLGPPPGTPTTTNLPVDNAGGLSQAVAETDGSGNLTAYYVRAGDELLEVMRPGSTPGTWSTRFVHHDGLGSVRGLTDETGTTIDTRGYEAFGTKNIEAGSDPLAYGFAGEPFEGTSRLAYHRARWMDARVGRFAGMDPFNGIPEAPPTLHRYLYVANDPANLTDATGLISPTSLLVGKAVHDAIGQDWENGVVSTTLNGRVYDWTINDLTGGSGIDWQSNWVLNMYHWVGALARPDLAARAEHAIYEIKSIDEYGQGQIKLGWYLDLLQTLDPASNWRPGLDSEYQPRGSLLFENIAGGRYFITVFPPESGVITYVWAPYEEALRAVMGGIGAVGDCAPDVSSLAAVGAGFL